MEDSSPRRQLVVPGELIDAPGLKAGAGTFVSEGRVFAATLGLRSDRGEYVTVIPISGRYFPETGDEVIGQVIDLGPSHWLIDLNAPYPAPLHATESPWRVDFGDTGHYMAIGDSAVIRVLNVDETRRVQVTMRDRGLRRLTSGQVIEVSHSKVPRVIGRGGSMITMIKSATNCDAFVGQNGRIWLDGPIEGIMTAVKAIRMIEERAQAHGLTEAVKAFLDEHTTQGP